MIVALGNRNFCLKGCCKPWCEAWKIHSGPSMVDTLKGECCVPETSVNTLQMWSGKPSGCSDPFVWEKVCFDDSDDWKVWQVPVNLAKDTLKMVSLEELRVANLCWRSKRTVAPHKCQKGWLLGYCHYWATTCVAYLKKRGLPLSMVVVPTIDKMVQPMCCHH